MRLRTLATSSPGLLAIAVASCFSSGLDDGRAPVPAGGASATGGASGLGGISSGAAGQGAVAGAGAAGGQGGAGCICGVTCAWGDFGAASPVENVGSPSGELDPFLSHDGLVLYFSSNREGGLGGWDLWAAARVSPTSAFGSPAPVSELNSDAEETAADLSASGLLLFFASARAGGLGSSDLWYASRASTSEPFGAPVHVSTPNSDAWDADPAVSLDRLTLYFASTRGGAGDRNLWMATRADTASSFDSPAELSAVNSSADDYDPSISSDGLELFFSTERDEQRDVWVARRTDVGQPFESAEPVVGVNTDQPGVDGGVPDNEWSPGIAPDGRTLYFVTDRGGQLGVADIWSATRSCP